MVVDGSTYAQSFLQRRRDKTIADLLRLHRDRLSKQPDGCMVRVFPTEYTNLLKPRPSRASLHRYSVQ